MDLLTLGLGAGTLAAIPLGAVAKLSWTNEHRISTLEADAKTAKEKLDTIDKKLDRLIERFL